MRAGGAVVRRVGPDHRLQRGLQHRHPHRRQRLAHVGHLEHAEQVGRRDPGQLPPPQRARGGDGPHRIGVPAGRRDQRARHAVRLDLEQLRVRCGPSAYSWITSGARISSSGTYADVPSTRISRLATAPSSRSVDRNHRCSASASLMPPVGQQTGIRVGGVGQPVQQRRQQHLLHPAATAAVAGQRRQVGQRALRTLVAQRGELTFGGLGASCPPKARRPAPTDSSSGW